MKFVFHEERLFFKTRVYIKQTERRQQDIATNEMTIAADVKHCL